MIYTLTFNPALDYVIKTDDFCVGKEHRTDNGSFFCGGKGINVSTVLNELSVKSVALGFIAGFTGMEIEKRLNESGIETDFIKLESGFSRINVKVRSDSETDINTAGPEISADDLNALYEKIEGINYGDILVVSGSVPANLPKTVYEDILMKLKDREVRFVVDAAGEFLMNALCCRPFLIKPNNYELADIFGCDIDTSEKATECARALQQKGARNVLVSMGENGSLLLDENGKTHFMRSYGGRAVNTVGAGDSMVAGFIAGYIKTGDFSYALKLGTAAGSATALSLGLADRKKIDEMLELIEKE